MYRYETHLHTAPVSKCATAGVREQLLFYRELGYDGVFITNHFLDGNVNVDKTLPYEKQLDFYLSDYYEAKSEAGKIGIKVFFGVELSSRGTDFLVYNLTPEWYYAHPEIMTLGKKDELALMRAEGAFIVHAHPFHEAHYIDHIRLYPRSVDAVEVNNASRDDFENALADQYADNYGLFKTGGSDNHHGFKRHLAGMECDRPIETENDYEKLVREGRARVFTVEPDENLFERVTRGDGCVTVQLKTNPSTGYGWEWEPVGECAHEMISEEHTGGSGLCGAPEFVKYSFRPTTPGECGIIFRYRRSWESAEPLRTFTLRFVLKEDGKISLKYHDFSN